MNDVDDKVVPIFPYNPGINPEFFRLGAAVIRRRRLLVIFLPHAVLNRTNTLILSLWKQLKHMSGRFSKLSQTRLNVTPALFLFAGSRLKSDRWIPFSAKALRKVKHLRKIKKEKKSNLNFWNRWGKPGFVAKMNSSSLTQSLF